MPYLYSNRRQPTPPGSLERTSDGRLIFSYQRQLQDQLHYGRFYRLPQRLRELLPYAKDVLIDGGDNSSLMPLTLQEALSCLSEDVTSISLRSVASTLLPRGVLDRALERLGATLRRLDLSGSSACTNFVPFWAALDCPHLEYLNLSGTYIYKLPSIAMCDEHFARKGMVRPRIFPQLRELSLRRCYHLDPGNVKDFIEDLPDQLEVLDLGHLEHSLSPEALRNLKVTMHVEASEDVEDDDDPAMQDFERQEPTKPRSLRLSRSNSFQLLVIGGNPWRTRSARASPLDTTRLVPNKLRFVKLDGIDWLTKADVEHFQAHWSDVRRRALGMRELVDVKEINPVRTFLRRRGSIDEDLIFGDLSDLDTSVEAEEILHQTSILPLPTTPPLASAHLALLSPPESPVSCPWTHSSSSMSTSGSPSSVISAFRVRSSRSKSVGQAYIDIAMPQRISVPEQVALITPPNDPAFISSDRRWIPPTPPLWDARGYLQIHIQHTAILDSHDEEAVRKYVRQVAEAVVF